MRVRTGGARGGGGAERAGLGPVGAPRGRSRTRVGSRVEGLAAVGRCVWVCVCRQVCELSTSKRMCVWMCGGQAFTRESWTWSYGDPGKEGPHTSRQQSQRPCRSRSLCMSVCGYVGVGDGYACVCARMCWCECARVEVKPSRITCPTAPDIILPNRKRTVHAE